MNIQEENITEENDVINEDQNEDISQDLRMEESREMEVEVFSQQESVE